MRFPEKLFVQTVENPDPRGAWAAHASLDASLSQVGGEKRRIAEYTLTRVVEAKMVPEVQCEVGQ